METCFTNWMENPLSVSTSAIWTNLLGICRHPACYFSLMHASTDKLVSGAESAALAASARLGSPENSLAILVSCVGRKLVMGSRVDEEVEAVGKVFGNRTVLTGFYSYGEISPFSLGASCKLHNQTMTITCLSED